MRFIVSVLFVIWLLPEACAQQDSTTVRMLTWNVFLRPRVVFHNAQLPRTAEIIRVLKEEDYDVVVLQEVFDKKATRMLKDSLFTRYPNRFGSRKSGLFKTHGGVLVLSKHPILAVDRVHYTKALGYDKRARKGAWLTEIKKDGFVFQVTGTHCQSGGGEESHAVRLSQLKQIEALLDASRRKGVPQFIAGDLNVNKFNQPRYHSLLTILKAKDGEIPGCGTTCNLRNNDLKEVSMHAQPKIIDYILVRGESNVIIQRNVKRFRGNWTKGKWKGTFLSDHEAIEAQILIYKEKAPQADDDK